MKLFSTAVALFLSTAGGTALFGFTDAAEAGLRSGAAAKRRYLQNGGNSDDCDTIVDAICDMPNSTTMCDFMTKNIEVEDEYKDLMDQLKDTDVDYTIFVPTDDAWAQDEDALKKLTIVEMKRIFEFHFYKNITLDYGELECSEKLYSMNLQKDRSRTICEKPEDSPPDAEQVKHQNGNGNTKSNHDEPLILTKDVSACNAALHGIDRVMLPYTLDTVSPAPSSSPTKCQIPSWKDWKKQAPSCSSDGVTNCVVAQCSFPMIWMTYAECKEAETPIPVGGGPAKAPFVKMGTCNKCSADKSLKSTKGAYYCYDPLLVNDVDEPKANLCLDPSCQHKKGSLTYIWDTWYCAKHNPCRNNDDDDDDFLP